MGRFWGPCLSSVQLLQGDLTPSSSKLSLGVQGCEAVIPWLGFPLGKLKGINSRWDSSFCSPANGFQQAAPNLHCSCLWKGTVTTSQDTGAAQRKSISQRCSDDCAHQVPVHLLSAVSSMDLSFAKTGSGTVVNHS